MPTKKKQPKKPKFMAMIDIKGYVEVEFEADNFKDAVDKAQHTCLVNFFKPLKGASLEKQEVIGIWRE